MRPRRARPPGFAAAAPTPPADPPPTKPSRPKTAPPSPAANPYRDAPARQLNIRLLEPLNQRYRKLLRALDDAGEPTTMTELLHALLHAGPTEPRAAMQLLDAWRRAVR